MSSVWPTDLVRLCERVAARCAAAGATHPVAAATMLAARGHTGLDLAAFAQAHGINPADVARAEAGDVAWNDLPDVTSDLLAALAPDAWLALADLDREYRGRANRADSPTTGPADLSKGEAAPG